MTLLNGRFREGKRATQLLDGGSNTLGSPEASKEVRSMAVVIDLRDRWLDRPAVPLDDAAATVVEAVGGKAANLAVARQAGLPVVDGFVVPAPIVAALGPERRDLDHLRGAWARLSGSGVVPLVVRSSAPDEDHAASSHAGQYRSVVDVRGWDGFVDAFWAVVRSAGAGGEMAVLVQHHVDPHRGGVLFGVDPVSGRDDRIVIAAVDGGPWALVQGEVSGRRIVVTHRGRVVEADGDPQPRLARRELRRLLHLARQAEVLYGGPQDVEWAI
jgi:phosphoenolpyruvate synthase/pyruvate phosphate dikinase